MPCGEQSTNNFKVKKKSKMKGMGSISFFGTQYLLERGGMSPVIQW
jgi:hypothetical protein